MTPGNTLTPAQAKRPDRPFGRGLITIGFAVILLFSGSLAAWSIVVPVESGVAAPGIVSVDTSVRTVQHLEGGIIEEILVREGDAVAAGDVLIRLQNSVSVSALLALQTQYFELQAMEARLAAEREGADRIQFPKELSDKVGDRAAQEAMAGQQQVFESERNLIRDRLGVLEREKEGLEGQVYGLRGQIAAAQRELALVEREFNTLNPLVERGLALRSSALNLEREKAQLEGTIEEHKTEITTAEGKIQESLMRMQEIHSERRAQVAQDLADARRTASEVLQKLAAATDLATRTEIRSPVSGLVVNLKVHTVGGVIVPGEPLLEVVPMNDKLVIRTMINPLDIDQVKVGLSAAVWLSAVNRRTHAALEGKVSTVSADRILDTRTGSEFYLARVELSAKEVERSDVPLMPGMSAEVMIRTGTRTTWDYITAPIARNLSRSLREE